MTADNLPNLPVLSVLIGKMWETSRTKSCMKDMLCDPWLLLLLLFLPLLVQGESAGA